MTVGGAFPWLVTQYGIRKQVEQVMDKQAGKLYPSMASA